MARPTGTCSPAIRVSSRPRPVGSSLLRLSAEWWFIPYLPDLYELFLKPGAETSNQEQAGK